MANICPRCGGAMRGERFAFESDTEYACLVCGHRDYSEATRQRLARALEAEALTSAICAEAGRKRPVARGYAR